MNPSREELLFRLALAKLSPNARLSALYQLIYMAEYLAFDGFPKKGTLLKQGPVLAGSWEGAQLCS